MQIVGGMLQMEVDLDRAKVGRAKIVDLLRENGGRSGEDFPLNDNESLLSYSHSLFPLK